MADDAGRAAYEALAEELSDPTFTMDDFDSAALTDARAYARRAKRTWPPRPTTSGWQVTILR